jgi:hypothetical protein
MRILLILRIVRLQVAHFEPDIIHLHGEGVFPRISLDLPRYIDESGYYNTLLKEARRLLMPGASEETLATLGTGLGAGAGPGASGEVQRGPAGHPTQVFSSSHLPVSGHLLV